MAYIKSPKNSIEEMYGHTPEVGGCVCVWVWYFNVEIGRSPPPPRCRYLCVYFFTVRDIF